MLMVTQLRGFGVSGDAALANVLIDRTAGTNIGDMTAADGLAAAFDGVTVAVGANCARATTATAGWIGKTLAASKVFGQVVVHGPNPAGFITNINPTVTIIVRGKNGGAPASRTDGTSIGSLAFTDTGDESAGRTIVSTDLVTAWAHIFLDITHDGAANNMNVAEVVLYEWA